MKFTSLKGAVLGAALAAGSVGVAHADPITFTFNPAAVGLAGSQFTANNFNVADFARIILTPGTPGSFQETGILTITQFLQGGAVVSTPGLGTSYSLYIVFNATGTQPPIPAPGGSASGAFTSLDYTLYAQQTATPAITVSTAGVTATPTAPRFALATGSLISGTTTLTNQGGRLSPKADVDLTFVACTGTGPGSAAACTGDESAFFVAPTAGNINLLIGDFSATTTVTTTVPGSPTATQTTLLINGGGGNMTVDFVPEPVSLSLLGTGLLGLGLLGRRRSKTAA